MEDGTYRSQVMEHNILHPHRLHGPWMVTLYWQEVGERWECVGISVRSGAAAVGMNPRPEPQPVTTSTLRSLPVASLVRESRRYLAGVLEESAWLGAAGRRDRPDARRTASRDRMQAPVRRQYDREHYEQVAEVYTAAWRAGEPPTKAVEEWGEQRYGGISRSAAANWVARARHMALLGKTEQRKPGGITPKGDNA